MTCEYTKSVKFKLKLNELLVGCLSWAKYHDNMVGLKEASQIEHRLFAENLVFRCSPLIIWSTF